MHFFQFVVLAFHFNIASKNNNKIIITTSLSNISDDVAAGEG